MIIFKWIFRIIALVGVIWLAQHLFDFKFREKTLTVTWNPNRKIVEKIGKEVEKSFGEAKKGMNTVRKDLGKKNLSPISGSQGGEEITPKDQEDLQAVLENKP